jgi:SAM-dependent methyltransferase
VDEHCNACGAARLAKALGQVRDPQSTERFDIERCAACGLGHTTPEPADLSAYYGPAYYGGRHSFTARYCTARRVRILRDAATTKGGAGKILDIGCGDGSFLSGVASEGWTVTGTEVGGAAELSAKIGIDVRDSLESARDRGPFDAITMWHTLEHFRDPKAIVSAAREQLTDDGVFIVAVPDAAGLQATVFKEKWFHLDVPRHLYHFTRGSLELLLGKSGFAVERWHHQELELDLFGWLQSALNTVFPQPNVLFQSLTGKPRTTGPTQLALSYALGTVLGPAAVAATAVGTMTGRGGTLIAIARARISGSRR